LRNGREGSSQVQDDFTVEIGYAGSIHQTVRPVAYSVRGRREGKIQSGVFTLERPRETRNSGGGHAVWIFEEETLTFLRAFQGGAIKRTFAFTRTLDGLNCIAGQSFAFEQGVRGIVRLSGIDNEPIIILSAKPVSSTCRVKTMTAGGAQ